MMASCMALVVDLSDYRSPESHVFAGRPRGESVRQRARIDEFDRSNEEIEVRVPKDTFTVSSSFFLGMFGKSVQLLGEETFRRRYRFVGANIRNTIEDGIAEALNKKSPL